MNSKKLMKARKGIDNVISNYTSDISSPKLVKTPLVSVCVITYNHAESISQALNSVLDQKVDFPIEIVIGDDASSDGTQEFLSEFQAKYSEKTRLLCAAKNLGSLTHSSFQPNLIRSLSACRGKYIALLEGDDCWLHPNKLQRQFDKMENSPEIGLCVHNAECLMVTSNTFLDWFPARQDSEYIIPYKDVYTAAGQFAPTASYFIRKSMLLPLSNVFCKAPVGDFFIEAVTGSNGVIYLPQRMSLYRRESSSSSWSSSGFSEKQVGKFNREMIASLKYLKSVMPRNDRSYVKYKIRHLLKKEYEQKIESRQLLAALRCRLVSLGFFYDLKKEIMLLAKLVGIKVETLLKIKNVFRTYI